jgi:hypothetical protein
MTRSGMAGLYARSIFSFLRTLSTVFHGDCTTLHSHQKIYKGSFFPHPHPHLLFVLLMIVILTSVRWNPIVALICISFTVKDVEIFFMYLLAILYSFFWKLCVQFICSFVQWTVNSLWG